MNILYILLAVLVLLFMITVHEFGHYIAGKIFKFKINEFAIGFGPAIFKRTSKKTGEVFSLRAIPLGGYCAFEGEDEDSDNSQAFTNKAPWKRIIVLISGALMNFAAALLIAIFAISTSGLFLSKVANILPDELGSDVQEQSALQPGDILLSANGKTLYLPSYDLPLLTAPMEIGEKIDMVVLRDGKEVNIIATIREYSSYENKTDPDNPKIARDEEGNIITHKGLGISQSSEAVKFNFIQSLEHSVKYSFKLAGVLLDFLGKLITGNYPFNQIGGPITTIGITAQTASLGLRPLLEIVILIGVNLAVFNLLPIPALDGMRVVFTVIEMILKRPLNRNVEAMIHFIGLIALFGLVILADILQLLG